MGVTLSDTLDTPYFAPHTLQLCYVSTDYILTIVCLKQAILGLLRILLKNKIPSFVEGNLCGRCRTRTCDRLGVNTASFYTSGQSITLLTIP